MDLGRVGVSRVERTVLAGLIGATIASFPNRRLHRDAVRIWPSSRYKPVNGDAEDLRDCSEGVDPNVAHRARLDQRDMALLKASEATKLASGHLRNQSSESDPLSDRRSIG